MRHEMRLAAVFVDHKGSSVRGLGSAKNFALLVDQVYLYKGGDSPVDENSRPVQLPDVKASLRDSHWLALVHKGDSGKWEALKRSIQLVPSALIWYSEDPRVESGSAQEAWFQRPLTVQDVIDKVEATEIVSWLAIGCPPNELPPSIKPRKWPEALVSLYLLCLACESTVQGVPPAVLGRSWRGLLIDVEKECGAWNIRGLSERDLTVKNCTAMLAEVRIRLGEIGVRLGEAR